MEVYLSLRFAAVCTLDAPESAPRPAGARSNRGIPLLAFAAESSIDFFPAFL
jgi:hypothetical protein